MLHKCRLLKCWAFILYLLCNVLTVSAAPTGLNIIPTADILDPAVLSAQIATSEADLPTGGESDDQVQTQIGLWGNTETGIDTSLAGEGTWWNIKYRLFQEEGKRPALAVGIQNVGTG